jgi:hypothetical protein
MPEVPALRRPGLSGGEGSLACSAYLAEDPPALLLSALSQRSPETKGGLAYKQEVTGLSPVPPIAQIACKLAGSVGSASPRVTSRSPRRDWASRLGII